MKLTFAKSDLENALRVPSLTVGADKNEISSQYIFREVGGVFEILSYNGPTFSSSRLVCQSSSEAGEVSSFTIPSKRLRMWLSAVEDSSLVFDFDGEKVTATCPRGSVIFQSMDPSEFPYWDEDMESASKVAEVSSSLLREAVMYARLFVSENESQEPRLCNMQFQEGFLYATNDASGVEISIEGMEKCTSRLRGKNTGTLSKFLSFCETVSIYEHDEGTIFVADTGSVLGEEKPSHDFPKILLGAAQRSPKNYWVFDKEEMLTCIKILTASADWQEELKIRLTLRKVQENIVMSMKSSSGEDVELKIPCIESESDEEAEDLPKKGFPISAKALARVFPQTWGNEIKVGLAERSPGGFLSLEEKKEGMKRLTVLGWILE